MPSVSGDVGMETIETLLSSVALRGARIGVTIQEDSPAILPMVAQLCKGHLQECCLWTCGAGAHLNVCH